MFNIKLENTRTTTRGSALPKHVNLNIFSCGYMYYCKNATHVVSDQLTVMDLAWMEVS